ncbi:PAS domain-containing protein [Salmonella enterica subsp. enterica]|nr:PAS domain-containing protein [Salmonella enterica subsp. enterica]
MALFAGFSKTFYIRIANGEHTGRKIARLITDCVAYVARHDRATVACRNAISRAREKRGVLMKSLTIAIRNREQRVIGLLCINMNLMCHFHRYWRIPLFRRNAGSRLSG